MEIINYHTWWPAGHDTFYIYAQDECNARISYYGVSHTPWLVVDGAMAADGSEEEVLRAIEERLLIPPQVEISVADTLIGDSVYVTAEVIGTENLDGKATLTFQCAAVEDWHRYLFIRHRYIGRDMVPDAGGENFSISQGDTLTFERVWWMDPVVYKKTMRTLVFVQDPATQEILNCTSTVPKPEHFVWYMAGNVNEMVTPDSTAEFVSTAYNLGTVTDTFDVDIAVDLLPGWTGSYTTTHGTFSGASQVFLAPGEDEPIVVHVDPANIPGDGSAELSVTGPLGTGVDVESITWAKNFTAIHDVDVLLVDDDGLASLESYAEAALDSTGLVHGTWNRMSETVRADDLAQVDAVVWMTGRAYPTLTSSDRNALKNYLLGGGNALVSGQDIGWALCDLSSTEWTPGGSNWFRTYLGALYVGDDAGSTMVYGVSSDPITDGMTLTIEGGDGADNQRTQDLIEPFGSGLPIFHYDAAESMTAAVRLDSSGVFKTAYLAFGFEGIDNAQDRADLMTGVMEWFGLLATTGVEDTEMRAASAWLAQNIPNPFNPETRIRFSLPEQGHVRLHVYNVRGQLVQVLRDGVMEAGEHWIRWNGTDRNGQAVASGLYFYSLETGDFAASKKMILLR